jgi:hypothetical protein
LGAAQSVRVRYGALDLGLADAVNVAPAADYDTDAILTGATPGPYAPWVVTRRSACSPTASRSDARSSAAKRVRGRPRDEWQA